MAPDSDASDPAPSLDADLPPIADAGPDAEVRPDAEAADSGPPVSKICGDAVRDPLREECDDGEMSDAFLCSASCRARDSWLLADDNRTHQFGLGPHVLAASAKGSGAVYVIDATPPSVWLAPSNPLGVPRASPIEVSVGGHPAPNPHPALAALPDGSLAVAYTDASGISPDIVLRKISKDLVLSEPRTAHIATGGPQSDVDLVWTGQALVMAYTDTADLSVRSFGADLMPLGPEEPLAATPSIESSVVLTPFADGYAAAWRAGDRGTETIRARAMDISWEVLPAVSPSPTGERPALAALDDQRLLLVFAENVDPGGAASAFPRLRMAVLSTLAPGEVTSVPLKVDDLLYAGDATLSQRHVRAYGANGSAFLVWEQESPDNDARGTEAMMQELRWTNGAVEIFREQPLAASQGEQLTPTVSVSTEGVARAVLFGWQVAPGTASRQHADLRWTLRPLPWLDLPK